MKFCSILFLQIAFSLNSFCQKLSSDELIQKSKCKDFDCFNDFIIKKGFSLVRNLSRDDGNFYLYSSDKKVTNESNSKVTSPNTVSITIIKNPLNETWVNVTSQTKTYFQSIKANFSKLGFTQTETESMDDNTAKSHVIVNYSSKKYPKLKLRLHTISREKDNENWTEYSIELRQSL